MSSKEYFNNLNGWQRLWVLFCLLYAPMVFMVCHDGINDPYITAPDIRARMPGDTGKYIEDFGEYTSSYNNDGTYTLITDGQNKVKIRADNNVPDEFFDKFFDDVDAAAVLAKKEESFNNLKEAIYAFLWPPIILYIFGFLVGWSFRGFFPKKTIQ